MDYNLVASGSATTLTVVLDDGPRVLGTGHLNFARIRDYLVGGGDDQDKVRALLDATAWVRARLAAMRTHVTFEDNQIHFQGHRLNNALSRRILRLIHEGDSGFTALIAFLENLALNPSQVSRIHLYSWLKARDFTITEDGMILAYKGVRATPDNRSVHSGNEAVLVNGRVHVGSIPNPESGVVRMERSLVAKNRRAACSVGLHVGTYEYASAFGERLLHVRVNPRDVVSVPRDSDAQKMRVCEYTVLRAESRRITAPLIDSTYYDNSDDDEGDAWSEDDDFDEYDNAA